MCDGNKWMPWPEWLIGGQAPDELAAALDAFLAGTL